jgi:hypothetical protein
VISVFSLCKIELKAKQTQTMTESNIETKSPFKHNENESPENSESVLEVDTKNKLKKSKKTHFYEPPSENSPIGILMKWWPGFKASVYARYQKSISSLTFLLYMKNWKIILNVFVQDLMLKQKFLLVLLIFFLVCMF